LLRAPDIEAAVVIDEVTDSGLKIDRKEKKVDICQTVLERV